MDLAFLVLGILSLLLTALSVLLPIIWRNKTKETITIESDGKTVTKITRE